MRSRTKLQIFKDLLQYLESKDKISLSKFAKENKLSNASAIVYINLFNHLSDYLNGDKQIKFVKVKMEGYEVKAVYLSKTK